MTSFSAHASSCKRGAPTAEQEPSAAPREPCHAAQGQRRHSDGGPGGGDDRKDPVASLRHVSAQHQEHGLVKPRERLMLKHVLREATEEPQRPEAQHQADAQVHAKELARRDAGDDESPQARKSGVRPARDLRSRARGEHLLRCTPQSRAHTRHDCRRRGHHALFSQSLP